jgi:hypothetical protein
MSFVTHVVIFWVLVIAAISILRMFPDSFTARVVFSHQGPIPRRGEARSRYMLRWAGYWGSWVGQCAIVFAACWLAASWRPELRQALWFLVFWVVVVPALAGFAAFGALVALIASTKAMVVGPDPISRRMMQSGEAETSLER